MNAPGHTLQLRSAPHLRSGASVDSIMFNVVLALLPACLFAVYHFGAAALITLVAAVVSCVLTEQVGCWWARRPSTVGDWSVVITGLLLGMSLPPGLPVWMTCVGGVLSVLLGKQLFGGLGMNPFNPALVGRAFLQAAFPAAMTHWPAVGTSSRPWLPSSTLAWPLTQPLYDGLSGATPLTLWKFERQPTDLSEVWVGTVGGCVGETSAGLLLLGGLYLALRRMLNWRIPLVVLATVAAATAILHAVDADRYAGPAWMIGSGGLMLGAMFMATDMVGSPLTHTGSVIYAGVIGLLIVVLRVWGGMPEGVMYAILLGNACTPLIDRAIQPRVYGSRRLGRGHGRQ
jgi:Na+-translocating ferredoxin:NAD+ oxidoreductase subunit D